jgi:hypothetical protein
MRATILFRPVLAAALVAILVLASATELRARGSSSSSSGSSHSSSGFGHSSSSSSSGRSSSWGSSSSSSHSSSWGSSPSHSSSSGSSGSSSSSGSAGFGSSTSGSSGRSSSWGSSTSTVHAGSSSGSSGGASTSSGPSGSTGSTSSSSWGTSTPRAASAGHYESARLSAADRALAEKAKSAGTQFQSRDDAVREFRASYGRTYTSNFASEPATRPDYIPSTTIVGGRTCNVIYHPAYGGYGYFSDGQWNVYDAMVDAAVADSLMRRHDYYYEPVETYYPVAYSPAAYGAGPAVIVQHGGLSGPSVAFWFCAAVLVVMILIFVLIRRAQARERARDLAYAGVNPIMAGDNQAPRRTAMSPPPAPPRPSGSLDTSQPEFWQALRPGALITLNDELARKDSQAKTGQAEGISYTVKAVRRVEEARGLGQWTMLHLQGSYPEFKDQYLWFVVKVVDDHLGLAVYEAVKDLAAGNRKDFIDRGDLWLFQKPEDAEHVVYNLLRYTMDITRTVEGAEIQYSLKPQGELQGTCVEEPAPSGLTSPLVATMVEYVTAQKCDNPELLVMEVGADDEEGGSITLMEGGPIDAAEVAAI